MPRWTKQKANELFTASSRRREETLSEAAKERDTRAALTQKLRAQRLAQEEADKNTALQGKKGPAKPKTGPMQSRQTRPR